MSSAKSALRARTGSNTKRKRTALASVESLECRTFLSTTTYLSDIAWASATNGWGPVERNMSNGGQAAGDGKTITLNGVTYSKGLGTNSRSVIVYNLDGTYTSFLSDLGIDDEAGTRGSVSFRVFVDGKSVYDSGTMTGSSATKRANVNLTGVKQLKLVVASGADNFMDHADWANARLIGPDPVPAPQPAPQPAPDPTPTPAPAPGTIVYSAPITITTGGTYTGNWQSLDANTPAVRIRTSQPVTIINSNISSRGTLIDAYGYAANITIKNTRGYGLNPNVRGRSPGRFLDVDGFTKVDVENCYMEGTAGVYLYNYQGDHSASQTVKILNNSARNIDGRYSDGSGGFMTGPNDNDYVQFFQINGVSNLVGAEIAWNQVINEPGKSRVEDNISIHNTSGTSGSPLLIHDNYIQGAYPADPANDDSYSGGGIMLADNGSSWVRAYSNQVLDTTNYGIAISSGHDNQFYNNRIISDGVLPDGRRVASQNVGAYIWNQNGESTFARNSGSGNVIGWQNGSSRNDWWVPDASSWTGNTSLSGTVTQSTVSAEWTSWQNKLLSAGLTAGPLA